MAAKHIPDGYHTITPYLSARGAQKVLDFLKKGLNGEVVGEPTMWPDGRIMHAEIKIGDSRVMLTEANEHNPATRQGLYVYVPDVDAAYKRAVAAGGESTMEPMDMFYGDRSGCVKDAAGNQWFLGEHKEDLSKEELKKRVEKMVKEQAA